jgi:diguanylate cyclase (GGDEF)-like protein
MLASGPADLLGSAPVIEQPRPVVAPRVQDLARQVLDSLPAQVAFVAQDGTIRLVNAEWERFAAANSGDPARSAIGASYFEACIGDPIGEAVMAGIKDVLAGRSASSTHEYPCHSDAEQRWFVVRCTPAAEGSAVVVHFDVTPQKRAEQALADLATRDHLTGALNRRGLEQHLLAERSRLDRHGGAMSAVLIDCDDFKRINDTLGLASGDVVLAEVTQRLQETLRPMDTLARIGGDEFVVLLPGTDPNDAALVAERMRLALLARPLALSHGDLDLTISLAVIGIDGDIHTLEDLLDRTRIALRASKREGKNRVAVAHCDEVRTGARPQLVELLMRADSMHVAAQPIVSLVSREVVAVELLSRTSSTPAVDPATLFRVAQEEGLLSILDERCLRRCVAVGRTLDPTVTRHVNVYPSTILQMSIESLTQMFEGIEPGSFCVELSEQQIIGEPTHLMSRLTTLRATGVRVALDDVGFGRTALESLLVLEPEIVKVDRVLVLGVARDREQQRHLRRLVRVADALGATLIAEGIEDEDDAIATRDLGVVFGQGYHFGRPSAVTIDLRDR